MEESDGETADSVWFGYECKSGEILFYYNQKTGEHRWAKDLGCSESNVIKVSISDLSEKHPSDVHSVGTQTEDYGCTNGCSSIYIHNEDHTVTSNRDESMCPVDRPSNICGVSVDDGDHLEQSETMIPNREDEDNVIDEEWNGGSEKLENDEDCILTDSCQSTGLLPENPPENKAKCNEECDGETQDLNFDSMMTDSCQSTQDVSDLIKDGKCVGNRNFFHKGNLNCQIRRHTKEKPFKCSYCGKAFRYKSNLAYHIITHTGEKPFKCSHCGKAFARKADLNRHVRRHTGGSEKVGNDEDCILTDSCQSTRLLPESPPEKGAKCNEECDGKTQDFNFDSMMTDSCQSTQDVSDLIKDDKRVGNRNFFPKGNLNCQIRKNTKEKPFKCSYCGKAFRYKSNLAYHIITHTGEKPFKCSHCGKAFARKADLNRHIRKHTGEKPFKCSQCGKGFTRIYSLRHHVQQITNSNTIHL